MRVKAGCSRPLGGACVDALCAIRSQMSSRSWSSPHSGLPAPHQTQHKRMQPLQLPLQNLLQLLQCQSRPLRCRSRLRRLKVRCPTLHMAIGHVSGFPVCCFQLNSAPARTCL